jgi:hypothetical protein
MRCLLQIRKCSETFAGCSSVGSRLVAPGKVHSQLKRAKLNMNFRHWDRGYLKPDHLGLRQMLEQPRGFLRAGGSLCRRPVRVPVSGEVVYLSVTDGLATMRPEPGITQGGALGVGSSVSAT